MLQAALKFIDVKLKKIRQWLSPSNPDLNYEKALRQRQADTGLWFLESDQYAKWKTDPASLIWLHGIPGCGKTILSSTILEDVLQCSKDDLAKAVTYFFFDFNDPQKQDPEMMVRSLICQLSHQCIQIPPALESLSECGQGNPSLDALLRAMHQLLQHLPQTYIILDALDESNKRSRLMSILEQLNQWQIQGLHLLVTSRKEYDIQEILEDIIHEQNVICLQSEVVDRDIQKYVRQRLMDDKSLRKWQKDTVIRDEIESALMKGAHGMYV